VSGLGGYLGYRVLGAFFGVLPEVAARRLGYAMGYASSYASKRRLALARSHLRRVVGEDADVDGAARRMFASYGRYWAEVFWARPRRRQAIIDHAVVEGLDHVLAARDSPEGVVFALPHVGNWEAAGAVAVDLGVPVLAVAEGLANKRLVDWFLGIRTALGIEVVLADESPTRRLVRRLKEGGTVALVCDRDILGSGIEVEFFGEITKMPAGPVALADRTGAVVLPVGAFFAPGRGHRLVVGSPLQISALADRAARVHAGVQALARRLEDIVRQDPEQWHLLVPHWPSDRRAS